MTFRWVPVVEGGGEVDALPVLLRRVATWLAPELHVAVQRPIRTPRDRFLNREEERKKVLGYAALSCSVAREDAARILVLLDADDDCPAERGPALQAECERIVGERASVSVVLANREYEAWFLASCETLQGVRHFDLKRLRQHWNEKDPDTPRNAKGMIDKATGNRYGEVADQAALSARIDPIRAAQTSRSFRKLIDECRSALPPR